MACVNAAKTVIEIANNIKRQGRKLSVLVHIIGKNKERH